MPTKGFASNGKVKTSDRFLLSQNAVENAKKIQPNFNTSAGQTFLQQAWGNEVKVQKLKSDDPNFGGDMGTGLPSIANRYSLFQYKGLSGQNLKADDYHDIVYRDWETDRKSTRLNSSHSGESRMPSSA